MYNIKQLKQYADKFLQDNYGLKLTVPLRFNGRLKTTCGWFKYYEHSRKPICVELNKFFAENNEATVVLDVLRHELVHYALFMQGKPHSDGHPVFENELRRLGVISQSTIDKYNIASKPRTVSIYKCADSDCGREYRTGRKLSNDGRYHRCNCGSRLRSLGKKVVSA